MRQFPRRCLVLGNQFAQISSFFLRQLYDILLHGGLLLVEQWFGFSCSSRIPLFPSTHHFIMDRTLGLVLKTTWRTFVLLTMVTEAPILTVIWVGLKTARPLRLSLIWTAIRLLMLVALARLIV